MSFECRQIRGYVVHVLVGQDPRQVLVELQRILDLDFRQIAVAPNRLEPAVGQEQRDEKVVEARELSGNLLATGHRDRRGHRAAIGRAGAPAASTTSTDSAA